MSDSNGGSGDQDSQEVSPSPPQPQRRPAARRDANNNTVPATGDVSRRHAGRGQESAAAPRRTQHTGREARAKRQSDKAKTAVRARGTKAHSSVPAGKRDKPRQNVTFEKQDIEHDEPKRKRSLFVAKDSSTEESPRHVQHSIFSQSDSADSEFYAPWHQPSKKSHNPRSPHIFSDIGTSTDGERLPASPPAPRRHVGTFKRYPVYDPRSVRNKALLSQENSCQAELSQGRGRGRGGRGRRGAATKRGAASKRGAGTSRARGGPSGRGATSAKRGVSRSQPAGGWAERVSREERRLQSPEVLRDEPAPLDEHQLSDADVPPAKRRPGRSLASRFGWESAGSEGDVPPAEPSPPAPVAPSRASRRSDRQRRTAEPEPSPEPAAELDLSGQHELCAELELSVPPEPAALDATTGSGHVSHLSVSATGSAPALACPPNTPLSAGKAAAPAAPTAAQLGEAMQWQVVSPQRARPPVPDGAALTATQEFRLDDHLVLEPETSRPVSPAPADVRRHATDSPLPPPPVTRGSQSSSVRAAPPAASQSAAEFRPPLPPPPPPSSERRPLPSLLQSLATDDVRAELSGMLADWETASVRSEQPGPGPAPLLHAVAAIRRQVARLEERDERLHQLSRRSAGTQETLLAQQRAAVATLERLAEAAAAARRQAAERILAECERLERQTAGAAPARAPAAAAPAAGGVESELQSVQRELDQLLYASEHQPQPQWPRY